MYRLMAYGGIGLVFPYLLFYTVSVFLKKKKLWYENLGGNNQERDRGLTTTFLKTVRHQHSFFAKGLSTY
jgi:hypothetical protein